MIFFFWLLAALVAGLCVAALVYALRRYEREGASAALAEREALGEELAALRARVEALEAIAAEVPLRPADEPTALPRAEASPEAESAPPTSPRPGSVSSGSRAGA